MSSHRGINCVMSCAIFILMILHIVRCNDIISTIAGTGTASYSGDSGQATSATLNYPTGVVVDSSGKRLSVDSLTNLSYQSS